MINKNFEIKHTINMTRLSVNINKVALIRNGRGGNVPDVLQVAKDCEEYGAEGITVHPRPDERHIRYTDVYELKDIVKTEFNVEGYPSEKFLDLVTSVQPDQVTLVPDAPGVVTSDQGWDIKNHASMLKPIIERLKSHGIRVSLFIDAAPQRAEEAAEVGADRIELYTGPYAAHYKEGNTSIIDSHIACANVALRLGVGINAGHDLNLQNLAFYKKSLPDLQEVSIGHALISDALYYGLQNIIPMYKNRLKQDE